MPAENFHVSVAEFGWSVGAVRRAIQKELWKEEHQKASAPFRSQAKVKLRPNLPLELRPYQNRKGIWKGYLGDYSHVCFGTGKNGKEVVTVRTSYLLPA